jgi:hypothetical protein
MEGKGEDEEEDEEERLRQEAKGSNILRMFSAKG